MIAVALLLLPWASFGIRVLLLVIGYNAGVALVAWRTGDSLVLRWWCVLAPMSVLMVLPDWFLSAELGVLVFPATGSPFIGTVPLFMAGMWVIALLPVMLVGHFAERAWGVTAGLIVVVITGLALFTAAEWAARCCRCGSRRTSRSLRGWPLTSCCPRPAWCWRRTCSSAGRGPAPCGPPPRGCGGAVPLFGPARHVVAVHRVRGHRRRVMH